MFGIGSTELVFILAAVVIGVLGIIFWIWMLVDCALNEPSEGNDKIVWIIIIVFAQLIGAIIYFFARRPKRMAELGR
jgi:hypothetical protein